MLSPCVADHDLFGLGGDRVDRSDGTEGCLDVSRCGERQVVAPIAVVGAVAGPAEAGRPVGFGSQPMVVQRSGSTTAISRTCPSGMSSRGKRDVFAGELVLPVVLQALSVEKRQVGV
ncbi:MAG: hypothetical protein HN750_03750 [Gemmatimonadales bacterium]|jgi:hypothetical protein|nr:hypothetical protein [Gemmatimonadales bacterium]